MRGRGRLDHRRARRRHRQEALHAGAVLGARPGRVPEAALRLRPGRPCEPGQADAHAAALRGGSRPLPRTSFGSRWGRGTLLSYEALAQRLRDSDSPVRIVGGRTKIGWGGNQADSLEEISTLGLDQVVEHNEGDLTAVLQAGVPLARAQAKFAEASQMLALDPPDIGGATIGGVVAAGDSGPLRHRYGAARDLVLGVTVALPDGSVARAGGKVIKNVAGYDLAKLFAGSFGTLGAIVELAVRLHPIRPTASAGGQGGDPDTVARAAHALAHSQLEAQALDVAWRDGRGGVLVRFAGAEAEPQAEAARRALEEAGLEGMVIHDDAGAWEAQRTAQRGALIVRVSGLQTQLADVLR